MAVGLAGCGKSPPAAFSRRSEAYRAARVRFASSLAAALLDGLCAYPAGYYNTETAHELIVAYCATIEFFGSLLGRGLHHCRRFLPDQDFANLHSDIRTQNVIQQVQERRAAIMAIDLVVLDPEGECKGHEHEEVR